MTSFLFSRVDGQGAGLKELRLTRELSLRCETRLYFGNGELMESETVVVGEQGEKFAAGNARLGPRPTWLPSQHRRTHARSLPQTRLRIQTKWRNNSSSNSSSSVRTRLLAFWSILDMGTAGESAVGKSRCFPLSHILPPHLHTPETHPSPVWSSDSSKISLTITGKAPSEVRTASL